jgi:hypothetical protein
MKLLPLTPLLAIICLVGIVFSGSVSAAPTSKARLHILPLKCVLEKINNGITDIHLLTPADCKKKIKNIQDLPLIEPGEDVLITPISSYAGPLKTEGVQQNPSEILIEDFGFNANTSISGKNLFIRGITLILLITTGILALISVSYVFITGLFKFL